MNTIDLIIFIAYCLLILCVGLFVSRGKKGNERDAGDYFLAGRGLAWWAIGASIIASNISAEQFVGMSGSGYAIGLAMATYEWIAALGLILVAKFFIPIFMEKKIIDGEVSDDLTVIYEEFLEPESVKPEFASKLINIIFKQKLTCRNKNIVSVVVIHEELE